MHRSTREQLENLLVDGDLTADRNVTVTHLQSCQDCAGELSAMRFTAGQLRQLKGPDELEPSAGFYARVLQRIEERAKVSEWGAFLYSPFSKRLAYASLSAALILGAYVFTEESRDGHLAFVGVVSRGPQVTGSPSEQRDAVLVNLTSFERSPQ